jgi:molybdate-binding protein/DNA-binding XRE family transcriptional regulator
MDPRSRPEITNRLAAIRKQRGISASALAATVGVSRQMIYAVESGSYTPNTAVGLRLAQTLGVNMEDLFSLAKEVPAPEPRPRKVTLVPPSEELQAGQAVQLCKVNGRLVAAVSGSTSWYLPASDAAISGNKPVRGTARISIHQPEADFGNRVLLAGCDPAMGMVARYLQSAGVELVLLHQNSSQSLSLLKGGYAHIAGSHLRDDASENSNVAAVNKLFPAKSVALISFALWQEGLVTSTGNPRHIKGVQDLARRDVTIVNREAGSGSRALLDRYLKQLKLDSKAIQGYVRTAPGHLAAAWEVKAGRADCCVSTEASARFFGLNFIPLETVRYDLAVHKRHLTAHGVEVFFDAMNQLTFRRKLRSIGGYDTSVTGTRIQ